MFYSPKTETRWFDARKPWLAAREAAGYPWPPIRDLRPAFGIEAVMKTGDPRQFFDLCSTTQAIGQRKIGERPWSPSPTPAGWLTSFCAA
jgi:hypothetical protein